ncbi:MAG: aminotransferase class I/II-fold pyridoxal phosphate-dependent enzyme [Christensenellales bacterium]
MTDGLIGAIHGCADKIRFHTPSHAGKLSIDAAECDVTELSYTDNLLSPLSHISALEKNMASAYGAEACFISTQGATGSIFQAVFSVKDDGAFLIVGQTHSSVYNALRVFGCKAYHIDELKKGDPVPDAVKTAIFTSPDYFGVVQPLDILAPYLKEKGIRVIVDSAHGAHFAFSSKLPVKATEYGDLVIYSLHKTLPVMTGGSVLAVKKEYAERCALARKTLHSTSPSFAIICSIEKAINDYAAEGERYYDEVIACVEEFTEKILPPFRVKKNDDITRVVLASPYDGRAVADELFDKGFVAEAVFGNEIVFIANPDNCRYLASLAEAVNGIRALPLYKRRDFPCKAHPEPTPIEFGGVPEAVELSEAAGRRAYCEVGFYPPGVPLIYSHDVITEEQVGYLCAEKKRDAVFGLENGKIFVLK